MKAVVCSDFGEARVEDVPEPNPESDEVVVAVDRVQLSVTECRLFRGAEIAHHESVARRLAAGDGRLFGHEFCGRVVETGADVADLAPGDRVYAPGKIHCGDCPYCAAGFPQHCPDTAGIGYDRPGALAERVALPVAPLRALPDDVTDAEGAAMQPLASALLCVRDAGIESGDVVAVVGAGVMGYNCGQLALERGAGRVLAMDLVERKLDLAAERGMTPVDAREGDPVDRIRALTDGVGADVVFEAVGGRQEHGNEGDEPLAVAYRAARRGGTVVQVGHLEGDVPITPRAWRSKGLAWVNPTRGAVRTGPNADTGEVAPGLVADGRVDLASFVTRELCGLASMPRAVDRTLDEAGLGPAQMIVNGDGDGTGD